MSFYWLRAAGAMSASMVGHHKASFSTDGSKINTRIYTVLDKIKANPMKSANVETIETAYTRGVFTDWEARFYKGITSKRKLSDGQAKVKHLLNDKLILAMRMPAEEVLDEVRKDPNASVTPDILEKALELEGISEPNREFYLNIWGRSIGDLSAKQLHYKRSLNLKMLEIETEIRNLLKQEET